jgi:hypothetical protein
MTSKTSKAKGSFGGGQNSYSRPDFGDRQGLSRGGTRKYGKDGAKQHSAEREQYYKFYLDSAQKAIEMMRK